MLRSGRLRGGGRADRGGEGRERRGIDMYWYQASNELVARIIIAAYLLYLRAQAFLGVVTVDDRFDSAENRCKLRALTKSRT